MRELTKKDIIQIIIIATIIVLIAVRIEAAMGVVLWGLEILYPFIFGACIAFVLHVPMNAIEHHVLQRFIKKKKYQRPISFFVTLLILAGIIFLVVRVVYPEMKDAFKILGTNAPKQFAKLQAWAEPYINNIPQIQNWIEQNEIDLQSIDWQSIGSNAMRWFTSGAGNIFSSTVGILSNVFVRVTAILIGFVFAIYVLFQKERLTRQSKQIMYAYLKEPKADRAVDILRLTRNTFANFISGQVMEAAILGTLFWITLSIFRFPYEVLVGVMIAVTALIPIVGAFIGCVISAFLILMVAPGKVLWFLLIFIILQQIEGNLIYPYVVGGKIGLPSMWVLFAVTVGASLMGITGILLFIPLLSVVYTLLKEDTTEKIDKKSIDQKKLLPKDLQ